jgi:hypothetical protein
MRLAYSQLRDPDVTEMFISDPNKGLNNRSLPIFAANTLGGGSAIDSAQFTIPELKVRSLPKYCALLLFVFGFFLKLEQGVVTD